jgi:hypothetical protein
MKELIGKKVKIQKDFEFTRILAALQNLNIDTKLISDKFELHSLFFKENETLFLLNKSISDAEFENADFEEINFEDFLKMIDIQNKESGISKYNSDDFIHIKYNSENFLFNKKEISYLHYKEKEKILTINLCNKDNIRLTSISEEDYLNIRKLF